jgi:hypothetical protein
VLSGASQGREIVVSCKGAHFLQGIVLTGVRWYVVGIELLCMLRKGQMEEESVRAPTVAEQFYVPAL